MSIKHYSSCAAQPQYIYSSAAKHLVERAVLQPNIIRNVAKGGWTEIGGYYFLNQKNEGAIIVFALCVRPGNNTFHKLPAESSRRIGRRPRFGKSLSLSLS